MRSRSLQRMFAGLVVLGLVTVACSSDNNASTTTVASSTGATNAPSTTGQGGGTTVPNTEANPGSGLDTVRTSPPGKGTEVDSINWALPYEASSFDPIKAWGYAENTIMANLCEGVLTLTPDFKLEPRLATKVDVSDPKKIVITVRTDAKFWDGNPVTAADVAYSLARNLDPNLGGYYATAWTNATSVDVTGTNEVTISLKSPDLLLWKWLATGAGLVIEKSFSEAAGENMGTPKGGIMCSGPYKLDSWVPGDAVTIARNDSYWDPSITPKVKKVVFTAVPDSAALSSALLTGAIDGTFTAPLASADELRTHTDVGTLYTGESTQSTLLIPNIQGPLGDVRLRKALSLVIDRTLIAKVAFGGMAEPGKSIDTPQTFGYGGDIFQKGYDALPAAATPDVAAAKALVDQYVAEKGAITTPLVMWVSGEKEVWTLAGNAVASAAKAIGIPIKVVAPPTQDFANWLYDPSTRTATDLYLTPWWTDFADPLQAFLPITLPGTFNPFNYSNKTVDNLLAQATALPDGPDRAKLVNDARKIMFDDDMMWIPIVNWAAPVWLNKRISGAPVDMPTYLYYPWAAELSGT
jgi:peptide/nickel transport system substrate-binding protein